MSFKDATYFPAKVRLSGADCFHLVLDKHAKKHQAGGNVMRKIFFLDNAPSMDEVSTFLNRSPLIHWLCNIKLVSGSLFTIPYWKYTNEGREILVASHRHDIDNEIPSALLEEDIPVDARYFIACDLIRYPNGNSALMLSWNHILMDGKGNALLVKHLDAVSRNEAVDPVIFFPGKENKTNVFKYIVNMYQVKKFVQDSSKPPICSVAKKDSKNEAAIKYKIIQYTISQTEQITTNAQKTGARFGNTLFYIACCSHAINAVNKKYNKKGVTWLPVPYDGRLRGALGPVISNCVSFLFYRIPETELAGIPQTIKCLAGQMAAQIKKRRPQKYTMFLNMMRHIPVWLYYIFISTTGRGVFASFLYTSTGDNVNDITSLFGKPVRDIAILPALTLPPGLTFIFLKHNNALKINMGYSPDMVSAADMVEIEQGLTQLFLADY